MNSLQVARRGQPLLRVPGIAFQLMCESNTAWKKGRNPPLPTPCTAAVPGSGLVTTQNAQL